MLEYLEGKRRDFDFKIDLIAPDFTTATLKALIKIPYGKTVTYGGLAKKIGRPKAARAVGGSVGTNPLPIVIPCHRVIGSDGKLTGFSSGLDLKVYLLKIENIL